MNVIDHAILIPASPEFIWRFLGDIAQNSAWQEDCINVAFLTTQHEGRGTRWRYTTPKGKDVIVEVSAWYDTLGYEYQIVEGGSISENQGRVRLQEVAEGTLVQWTFNYELDGVLSGLRNTISLKRILTNNIQDSLRNLYKLIQQETGGISTHEARASLREAPDVEEREKYQPRHPTNFKEVANDDTFADLQYPSEASIDYQLEHEGIIEPPVADDDTQPNPVVQGTDEIPAVNESESISIFEPPATKDDTQPNAPIETMPETLFESGVDEPFPELLPDNELDRDVPVLDEKPDIRDTSRISVFEVFGLQKPSDTEEMSSLTDEEIAEMTENSQRATVETETVTPNDKKQATIESETVASEHTQQEIIESESKSVEGKDNQHVSIQAETNAPEDTKRETVESEIMHVDEPTTSSGDEEPVSEDDLSDAPHADIPEIVAPDAIEDASALATQTTTATQSSQTIVGLRLELRRKMVDLRNRK